MREICWFRGTAGHLMKMRDCPSECGTVDTYDFDTKIKGRSGKLGRPRLDET